MLCYGTFGFGYIVPATFLPAMAQQLVPDPLVFGLTWPLFGLAAALSVAAAARWLPAWPRRRVWALAQGIMALGTALPLAAQALWALAASAVLVGGTFMVATMAGLQLAREQVPANPTPLLARMTAAFAAGQIAGPLLVRALGPGSWAGWDALAWASAAATVLLVLTAAWLWRDAEPSRSTLRQAPMNLAPSTTSVLGFPEAGCPNVWDPPATLDTAQQEAADELINGPRRGVYGPFRPLLHRPPLLRAVAKVGETLRYEGTLDAALREWTICVVARELSNVFEWDMHLPLAAAAGVPTAALAALEAGEPSPDDLRRRPRARPHRCQRTHRPAPPERRDLLGCTPAMGRADDGGTAHAGGLLRDGVLADERGAHAGAGDLS